MNKLLWKPSNEVIESSKMNHFREWVNEKHGHTQNKQRLKNYQDLYQWSVEKPEEFWADVWDYFGVIASSRFSVAVEHSNSFREVEWFPGAKLNYTENMLRYSNLPTPAIIFRGENLLRREISRADLKYEVLRMADSLKKEGVKAGDVVAAYMPNIPETVIAMLATSAIGAIWCSCATDIGANVALDRIGQTNPVVLFTCDGYYYKGKAFSIIENAKSLAENIPTLKCTVVCHYAGELQQSQIIPKSILWEDFLNRGVYTEEFIYPQFGYDHPQVIMFSSGTTGKPKCMVQSAIGLLVNQLKELILHSDLGKRDRLLYITICSWMMWNWQAAAIGTGATLVLYDGNPSWPDTGAIWRVIEEEKVTVFGLSASYIHSLLNEGFSPKKVVDLASLREISQTGSALSEKGFDYIYNEIKSDIFFNSIAGGTDINGCFCIASPVQPVYANELQGPGLGMNIDCFDENAKSLRDDQGELVCKMPTPSMPLYFWNDEEGKQYYSAYFDIYPNIWRHGDYCLFHGDTKGVSYFGRSDSILKPSGVRIGTAEIYNQVNAMEEIEDSLAIGQDVDGDQRVLLFVKLNHGFNLNTGLEKKIKTTLRTKASPRHVPALIVEVPDIPRTLNGKKVESAVTNIINGRDVTNRDALGNPKSLDFYVEFAKNNIIASC